MFPCSILFPRSRRAAVAQPCRPPAHPLRTRRGWMGFAPLSWRRLDLGSNAITAFGVWRRASRRCARRVNAKGDTAWRHRAVRSP